MGKNNKKRKGHQHALFHAVQARLSGSDIVDQTTSDASAAAIQEETTNGNSISDADLATAIRVVDQLAANDDELSDRRFKELRRALHPLVLQRLQSYDNGGVDYRHRVTSALQHAKWSDALLYLQACADFQQAPKQGTVQRWVRDVCAAAGGTTGMACQLQLLRAMVQLADHTNSNNAEEEDLNSNQHSAGQALAAVLAERKAASNSSTTRNGPEDLVVLKGWKWWHLNGDEQEDRLEDGNHTSKTTSITATALETFSWTSRVLYHEPAADRTPPNHFDLRLHAIQEHHSQWMTWSPTPPVVAKHAVPFLQTLSSSAFVLANVLTRDECRQLRQAAAQLGFQPDHPVALPQPTGIDSCEWFVGPHPPRSDNGDDSNGSDHDTIADVVFQRVHALLPATIRNARLHSINPRWRCFRYTQDCVYRPHLDGSWPASHVDRQGNYVLDTTGTTRSYLTFLVYLNDDFRGGETRFYLPSGGSSDSAVMTAQGVVPKEGCVLVFPQGNTASFIHEGSAVTEGIKYVVRTDVLYTTAAPEPVTAEGETELPQGPTLKRQKRERQ